MLQGSAADLLSVVVDEWLAGELVYSRRGMGWVLNAICVSVTGRNYSYHNLFTTYYKNDFLYILASCLASKASKVRVE